MSAAPPRVTLFSYHYLLSKRRAGFHWIADAAWRLGWDVVFVTAPISALSRLRRDFRLAYPVLEEANRLVRVDERMSSYVLYTSHHPVSSGRAWLDRLTAPIAVRYGRIHLGPLADVVAGSHVVIVESTPALLLVPQLRALSPGARFVYRASDDLTFGNLRIHPEVIRTEQALVRKASFDLVSAASHITVERLGRDRAQYDPHGIAKHLFGAAKESPYGAGTNVVWVGTKWMDDAFLVHASAAFPDWTFHVIGPIPQNLVRANVRYYGEMPFEDTVAYVRYADIGLATFPPLDADGRSTDTMRIHSLKTTQYTYCGLPVVAPDDLLIDRPNVFPYRPSDPGSVRRALQSAAAAGRRPDMAEGIASWDDLTRTLLGVTDGA